MAFKIENKRPALLSSVNVKYTKTGAVLLGSFGSKYGENCCILRVCKKINHIFVEII